METTPALKPSLSTGTESSSIDLGKAAIEDCSHTCCALLSKTYIFLYFVKTLLEYYR